MSKNEWIWVAIRIFGIYLLVLAIISIPDAIGNIYALIQMADGAESYPELASMARSLNKAVVAKGTTATSQLVIFSIASYYFLRHGKAIHKMANHENA